MAADEALHFPAEYARQLEPYLPPVLDAGGTSHVSPNRKDLPFVTLTYATSLDGAIAAAPGTRTVLSGPQSKAMTHFLRTRHAAICVGVGTAEADDPGLNSRLAPATGPACGSGSAPADRVSQPRPIIIDPHARWAVSETSKVVRLAQAGQGLAPYVLTAVPESALPPERRAVLEACGGKYIVLGSSAVGLTSDSSFQWRDILAAVRREGLDSIMIEGGGHILRTLLVPPDNGVVDSVIVTIAPTWLGQNGVVVSPSREREGESAVPAPRLRDTFWLPLGEDMVLCGKLITNNGNIGN
ncbi:bacterial bifunctional deaminase-reductase [Thozetella sp. PMI_491]|nr:bacterial bifunctional deaminase-reductase [Thozetella sp. PMI_491]